MTVQVSMEAERVTTVADFKQWVRTSIRPLLPHGAIVCGYGHMHAGGVALDCVVADDFPLAHLKNIRNKAGGLDTPILRRWIATERPQLFEVDRPWPDIPHIWLGHFRRTGLKNIIAHAVYDRERCVGTYHSFYDLPGPLTAAHAAMLERLCPILHEVLCGVVAGINDVNHFAIRLASLTGREREVLHCIGQGKTNRDVADMLCVSEVTVKHHLMKIFAKLDVVSRLQLVTLLTEHQTRVQPEYGLKLLQ